MSRVTPFQRGVLTGVALAGAACTAAALFTLGTVFTLAFADDTEDDTPDTFSADPAHHSR